MSSPIAILDHGYVKFVESWGSDERIIEAARMSTSKGFVGWGPLCQYCGLMCRPAVAHADPDAMKCPEHGTVDTKPGDEKLLRFLYENRHATPFEMAGMTIEVQAPIFVFREWHRHRTQSYNEMSARYTPLPNVNYVPTVERLLATAGANKQAQGTGAQLDADSARLAQHKIKRLYADAQVEYEDLLAIGAPKELARVVLPVGRYSRMMASTDLRNWLAFLTLRMAPNAQFEIRQFANAVGTLIEERFPRTWALFAES